MNRSFRNISALAILLIASAVAAETGSTSTRAGSVADIARRYLGIPYKYGGSRPSTGFDCSGFTSYVYSRAGLGRLPHSARSQFQTLRPIRVPRPGDLVFFRTMGNRISHVGIYVGNFQFIHSPRTGKTVEYADIRGKYWVKRYAGARTTASLAYGRPAR